MKKYAIFGFNGNLTCFAHAMLNVLDLNSRPETEAVLVIEGASCSLIGELAQAGTPFHAQYTEIINKGYLAAVCRACCAKLKTLDHAKEQQLPLGDDMSGHPSFGSYLAQGYEIITI
ncbi:MAG: cytoplasmic protein [Fibrobacterota bacterium]